MDFALIASLEETKLALWLLLALVLACAGIVVFFLRRSVNSSETLGEIQRREGWGPYAPGRIGVRAGSSPDKAHMDLGLGISKVKE